MPRSLQIPMLIRAAVLSRARYPGTPRLLYHLKSHPLTGLQPDGYLTPERKAADPDQGFSTFFTETGKRIMYKSRTSD